MKILQKLGETSTHLIKTYIVYGFIAISMVIIKVLIARLFGQEELGIYTYFFSIVSLVVLFTGFGLPEAVTQTIIKDKTKIKSSLKKLFGYSIITSILFGSIAIFIIQSTELNPHLKGFNIAVIIYIIANGINYTTYSILRGMKRFATASLYSLLYRVLFILFILGLFFTSANFINVLYLMSLGLLIAGILAIPKIVSLTPKKQILVENKTFLALAGSLFLVQVSFYSLRFVDALMIKYLVDFASLGFYSAHSSITNVIRLLAYVFPAVVVPLAAISKYKLRKSFHKLMIFLIPFGFLVLGTAYIIVPLFYGIQYKSFTLPTALVFASSLLIIYAYFNSVLAGENTFSKKYLQLLGVDFILSLFINTGLNYWFILKWGVIGAPIATSITIIIKILLNIYGIKKLRLQSTK